MVANLRIYLRRFRLLRPAVSFHSKQLKVDWFRETRSATRIQDALLLRHPGMCHHGNHGNLPRLWLLPHPGEQVEAVIFTEIDIKQYDIEKPLRKKPRN